RRVPAQRGDVRADRLPRSLHLPAAPMGKLGGLLLRAVSGGGALPRRLPAPSFGTVRGRRGQHPRRVDRCPGSPAPDRGGAATESRIPSNVVTVRRGLTRLAP